MKRLNAFVVRTVTDGGTLDLGASLNENNNALIGGAQDGGKNFEGIIDDLYIDNQAITDEEITERYQYGRNYHNPSQRSVGGYVSAAYLAQHGIILENSTPATQSTGPVCSSNQPLTLPINITALQAKLSQLGFNPGPIDGVSGPMTINAIKQAQTKLGTIADGIVGPITLGLLNTSCK
jgi:hypothetical protein